MLLYALAGWPGLTALWLCKIISLPFGGCSGFIAIARQLLNSEVDTGWSGRAPFPSTDAVNAEENNELRSDLLWWVYEHFTQIDLPAGVLNVSRWGEMKLRLICCLTVFGPHFVLNWILWWELKECLALESSISVRCCIITFSRICEKSQHIH